ncbi:MAG: DUF1730 domain-containing protein [Oscillospiraceae bacterium]|nr:DUF1730 domain-containing protein [Oscillospiraceae bacterium]
MDFFNITENLPYGVIPFSIVENRLLNVKSRGRIPQNAKSVLLVLFPYYLGEEAYQNANMARYAVSCDYHGVVLAKLTNMIGRLREHFPDEAFVCFVDNSPIPEKYAAVFAGLGVLGKNTLLLNERYGSYFFIGEIVTTADLGGSVTEPNYCIGCLACVRACPSGALKEDGTITPSLCVSAITQKKGELSEEEQALIRKVGSVWGCDRCQTACPMNKNPETTHITEWIESARPVYTKESDLEDRAYLWRGKPVADRNWDIINGDMFEK